MGVKPLFVEFSVVSSKRTETYMARLALEVLGKPVAIVLLRGRLQKVPEHIYLSKWLDTFVCNGSGGVERRCLNISRVSKCNEESSRFCFCVFHISVL